MYSVNKIQLSIFVIDFYIGLIMLNMYFIECRALKPVAIQSVLQMPGQLRLKVHLRKVSGCIIHTEDLLFK